MSRVLRIALSAALATAHSRLRASTPEYVRQTMVAGRRCADGVLVYCHQDPARDREKFEIVRQLFREWAAEGPGGRR